MNYRFIYHNSAEYSYNLLTNKDPAITGISGDYANDNEAIKAVARKGFTLGISKRVNKFPCIDIFKDNEFIARMAQHD